MKKTIMLALALMAGAVFAEFQAGFARVDATPPLGIPLVGYFSHRVSDGFARPRESACQERDAAACRSGDENAYRKHG